MGDHAIDYFNRDHPLQPLKSRLALRARRRMYERVLALARPAATASILDVGITPDLALPYNNFFERWYPHTERVTGCSIEDGAHLERVFSGFKFVRLKDDRFPFADREFDLALSFAVLEHVGSKENQRLFLSELARISNQFIVYTPYRYFPVEMHTFWPLAHWLPRRWHRALWRRCGQAFWAEEANLNLLSVRELRAILPPGGAAAIHLVKTLGWPSNLEVHWIRR